MTDDGTAEHTLQNTKVITLTMLSCLSIYQTNGSSAFGDAGSCAAEDVFITFARHYRQTISRASSWRNDVHYVGCRVLQLVADSQRHQRLFFFFFFFL